MAKLSMSPVITFANYHLAPLATKSTEPTNPLTTCMSHYIRSRSVHKETRRACPHRIRFIVVAMSSVTILNSQHKKSLSVTLGLACWIFVHIYISVFMSICVSGRTRKRVSTESLLATWRVLCIAHVHSVCYETLVAPWERQWTNNHTHTRHWTPTGISRRVAYTSSSSFEGLRAPL